MRDTTLADAISPCRDLTTGHISLIGRSSSGPAHYCSSYLYFGPQSLERNRGLRSLPLRGIFDKIIENPVGDCSPTYLAVLTF